MSEAWEPLRCRIGWHAWRFIEVRWPRPCAPGEPPEPLVHVEVCPRCRVERHWVTREGSR